MYVANPDRPIFFRKIRMACRNRGAYELVTDMMEPTWLVVMLVHVDNEAMSHADRCTVLRDNLSISCYVVSS